MKSCQTSLAVKCQHSNISEHKSRQESSRAMANKSNSMCLNIQHRFRDTMVMQQYVDPDKYVAVPKDRHKTSQTDQTDKAIRDMLGDNNVYSYVSPYEGLAFWFAPMTAEQQNEVKELPGVSGRRVELIMWLSCSRLRISGKTIRMV